MTLIFKPIMNKVQVWGKTGNRHIYLYKMQEFEET